MQEKIGRLIATCRHAQGMTQRELAEKLGVTDKAVSKWERGKSLPDASLYGMLCSVLDVTLEELFAGARKSNEEEIDRQVLAMLERYVVRGSDVSEADFHRAMQGFVRTRMMLDAFETKAAAVEFLMRETGIAREECEAAYEFLMTRR